MFWKRLDKFIKVTRGIRLTTHCSLTGRYKEMIKLVRVCLNRFITGIKYPMNYSPDFLWTFRGEGFAIKRRFDLLISDLIWLRTCLNAYQDLAVLVAWASVLNVSHLILRSCISCVCIHGAGGRVTFTLRNGACLSIQSTRRVFSVSTISSDNSRPYSTLNGSSEQSLLNTPSLKFFSFLINL